MKTILRFLFMIGTLLLGLVILNSCDIQKKSLKNNIDPKITNKIWRSMIYAYIDFEKRNFKKK